LPPLYSIFLNLERYLFLYRRGYFHFCTMKSTKLHSAVHLCAQNTCHRCSFTMLN
jgi:hypothetical protein